ncbi:hypothetical protein M430DRAFT_16017 [Amorphotheca resinae ATCC 22711]|uniref:Uncharacterized protein n=1 Tax=Amorphotheca resinae ATCC 22711 TaxID=857342 RepID=A0A2T3BAE1_AMORE|nr:hypothetical protein M430DRAFT_16017 [Amorphotheca resinae ATCC 22711]PSS25293.1 hypothetical protein M430DRAFT_16017 [Amorphotheca resinae ATCC 22711]
MKNFMEQESNMKNRDTAYEQSRGCGTPSRPVTAAKKVKSYLSSRLYRHSDVQEVLSSGSVVGIGRPATLWPTTDMREEEKAIVSANSFNKRYSPLTDADGKKIEKTNTGNPLPALRRKPKFKEVLREKLRVPTTSAGEEEVRDDRETDFRKLQALRNKIREGKLEQAVRPVQNLSTERSSSLPRHPRTSLFDPPFARHPRHKKANSTSSRVAEYFGTTADILDERRRELAGKFRPPFEHLSYASFSLSRRNSTTDTSGSQTSSETFFCIGEDGSSLEVIDVQGKQADNGGRRMSGDGTNPWECGPPKLCRLCKNQGVRGVRGLCNKCEKDFMGPKTLAFGASFSPHSYSQNHEIKPTPPLKDRDILSARKVMTKDKSAYQVNNEHGYVSLGVPDRGVLKRVNADRKPTVIKRTSQEQGSRQTELNLGDVNKDEEEEEEDEKYRRWQTRSTRSEYERAREITGNWPSCHENGDFDWFEEESDITPLVGVDAKGKYNTMQRHSSFYQFWDEILRDHGAKTRVEDGK